MRSSAMSNRSRGACSRLRKNTARKESASRPPISQIQTTAFNAPKVCPRSFSCALTCCSAMVVAMLNECDNGASRESVRRIRNSAASISPSSSAAMTPRAALRRRSSWTTASARTVRSPDAEPEARRLVALDVSARRSMPVRSASRVSRGSCAVRAVPMSRQS